MSLRDYQQECLEEIRSAGIENQLVALPTGTGKTLIFSHLPEVLNLRLPQQMLVLVHRDKLIEQNAEKLAKYNPSLAIEIEAGSRRAHPFADVIVGSIQTLQHAKRRERFNPAIVKVVIVDEAHHVISPSYLGFLEYFQVYKGAENRVPGKLLVGFTATPKRGDKIGLEKVFDKIVFARSIREMVEANWLVEPTGYHVSTMTDISDVGTRSGDFKEGELSDAVNTFERNRLVVQEYQKLAAGLTFAAFTVTIQHSKDLADVFWHYGISCEAISSETPDNEREVLYRRHECGDLLGLASCGVLSEGWDNPRCTVGLGTRPTKSPGLFIQQLGRQLRPYPAPEDAATYTGDFIKQFAIWVDFCDNTGRHSIVTLPTLFGLRADFDLAGKSATRTAKQLEGLLRQTPGLDIEGYTSLRQIEALVRKVDLLGPIKIPAEVQRMSKFGWVKDGIAGYRLSLADRTFYINQDVLGQWELQENTEGHARILFAGKKEDAFTAGDAAVPREQIGLVLASAKWKSEPPNQKQCWALYYRDGHLRRKHFDGIQLYQFAMKQYAAGNTEWSKGGISDRLNALAVAKAVKP